MLLGLTSAKRSECGNDVRMLRSASDGESKCALNLSKTVYLGDRKCTISTIKCRGSWLEKQTHFDWEDLANGNRYGKHY